MKNWSFSSSGRFDMEVVHSSGSGVWSEPKLRWSGIYTFSWVPRGWKWIDAESVRFDPHNPWLFYRYNHGSPKHANYYYPGNLWDYYICKIVPGGSKSSDWIEVWFWTGGVDSDGEIFPPSAFVYDSEGNFYSVDLTIE